MPRHHALSELLPVTADQSQPCRTVDCRCKGMHPVGFEHMTENHCSIPAARRPDAGDGSCAELRNFAAEPLDQRPESRRIGQASSEIKNLERIPQQDAARSGLSRGAEKVERRHIERALKSGKRNDQTARVGPRLDDDIRAAMVVLC